MTNSKMKALRILALLGCVSMAAQANVTLNGLFGDHMVLQRELPVSIFGTADPGEKVTVAFAGQQQAANAGQDGKWAVRLAAMKPTKQAAAMTVTGKNQLTLQDVVVGDVWVCSGQSNMDWRLAGSNRPDDVKDAAMPLVRQFNVPQGPSDQPRDEVKSTWVACSPESAPTFTAVGFYFARKIHRETGIPIGLIHSSWGGTLIEPWTAPEGLATIPEPMRAGTTLSFVPSAPAVLYNAMIHPLTRFPIKGALWYQGESNALFDANNSEEKYYNKMVALINGWRKVWNIGEFPFYYVQLVSFDQQDKTFGGPEQWPAVRMGQLRALAIPHTGMAVAIDLADPGNPKDIHPKNKLDVGERLARWALARDYGKKDLLCSGPLYKAMRVEGSKIRIAFDFTGTGLMVGKKNGYEPVIADPQEKLQCFTIAGEDRKWVPANAVIDGKTVVVSSPEVPKPVAVRYAFAQNPAGCNLYNKEGLPASPFRSDTW